MMKYASSPSGSPRAKSKKSSTNTYKTDFSKVPKFGMPTEDHPELDFSKVIYGTVRVGLQPVPPKEAISLRIDADVLAWYKAQEHGYQTKMNAVLKAFRDASLSKATA